jgi:phasin family protein
MYNPTEQIAEFNKTNVAQADEVCRALARERREVREVQPGRGEDRVRAVRRRRAAVASVKDVQDLIALRTKFAEAGVQTAVGYSRHLYELATEAQAEYSALAEEAFGVYSKSVSRVGRPGEQVGAGRFRRCRQRVQVDDSPRRPPRSTSSRRLRSKS